MHPKTLAYAPITTLATAFADDVTLATSATLAATAPTDGLAHLVTILGNAATNHSGKTITIVGTDADGRTLTEAIAGPNGIATVASTEYFKTVTSVTASATCGADTFDIGILVGAVSPTYPMDHRIENTVIGLGVNITGTINCTVQQMYEDPFDAVNHPARTGRGWVSAAAPFAGLTGDVGGSIITKPRALRLLIVSVTNTATVRMSIVQGM